MNTDKPEKNAIVVQTTNYQYYIIRCGGICKIDPKVVIDSKFYKKYVNIMNKFEKLQKELSILFNSQE